MVTVAIVVPTRDRRESLLATLNALEQVEIPDDHDAELVIVDNGSGDGTAEALANTKLDSMSTRVLTEPRPGVSRARNLGARASKAAFLLFLDDDVRPPRNWLRDLTRPIVAGDAAATVSLFEAAPGRDRPWLTDADRGMLMTARSIDPRRPFLVGGSMAIGRAAFDAAGGFEEELGPGALGPGGEDILLTHMLRRQGAAVACVESVVVEHWFDESKMEPAALAARRVAGMRTEAWLSYHWFGRDSKRSFLKAPLARLMRRPESFAWHDQMRIESRRPRRFTSSRITDTSYGTIVALERRR